MKGANHAFNRGDSTWRHLLFLHQRQTVCESQKDRSVLRSPLVSIPEMAQEEKQKEPAQVQALLSLAQSNAPPVANTPSSQAFLFSYLFWLCIIYNHKSNT